MLSGSSALSKTSSQRTPSCPRLSSCCTARMRTSWTGPTASPSTRASAPGSMAPVGGAARRDGVAAGRPGFGRAWSRPRAPVIRSVEGQCFARRRMRRRPVVTSWAAAENSRSRRRRGSWPVFAGQGEHRHPGVQVESDLHDLQPDLVLCGRPGCGPPAMARWRCRSSRVAIGVFLVLVAKQGRRMPSASVKRS